MKITSTTMKDILQAISESLEPKDTWKIIFPLIDEIETLQSTLEIVAEERKEYEKEAKGLKERIEQSEKNNEDNRNIIQSIEDGISLENLYENIKEIGDLLNSDLSEQIELIEKINENFREQIELIEKINENFREGQKEITTLIVEKDEIEIKYEYLKKEKERIEIQCVQLQKENERKDNIIKSMEKNSTDLLMTNEELREEIKKTENTNAILHGRIMTEESENKKLKEKISNLEDTNKKLSGELLNQTEEIHLLEEEIDRLKSENEDLNRLNRQIQEVQK